MNTPESNTHLILQDLLDNELIENTQRLVETERKTTNLILQSFAEIEARRLYAQRGYPSMFAMAVDFFKYSAGAAERRISASRLLRQLPEVEHKIKDGTLNLTVAAKAHTFFEAERRIHAKNYTLDEKREVLALLENKSTREAERELLRISPEQIPREYLRPLTESHTEIRLVVGKELLKQLDELREQLSHANPKMTYSGLVQILARNALAKKVRIAQTKAVAPAPVKDTDSCKRTSASNSPIQMSPSKNLPRTLRRGVFLRDHGSCTYLEPSTGKRCSSRSFLEVDHVTPKAHGGKDEVANLRLVCRAHNQLFAIRSFGEKKMNAYLQRRSSLP